MKLCKFARTKAALLALVLSGCSTTTFSSTWQAPDAQPLTFREGDKVVAVVFTDSGALRRAGEDSMAAELNSRGLKGIASYILIEDRDVKSEERVKAAIEHAGAVGVIAIRPIGKQEKVTTTQGSPYGAPYYGGFWGVHAGPYGGGYNGNAASDEYDANGGRNMGYYNYASAGPWTPSTTRVDTYVTVETLVFDLRQNKLIWAGKTVTENPDGMERFIKELAKLTSRDLRERGLAPGGSW
jgi:hypothetical protein